MMTEHNATNKTPDRLYHALFYAAQSSRVLGDSKKFVDAIPKRPPNIIMACYLKELQQGTLDLAAFIHHHFDHGDNVEKKANTAQNHPLRDHIELLWDTLTRPADNPDAPTSLIALPKPYIVPGGRFREIHYWDSYFTMLGLAVSGRIQTIEHMVENFAYLLDSIGFIPNGNRTYFCSRSQPPFFSLMVELLALVKADQSILVKYLPQLSKEYAFWMSGAERLAPDKPVHRRVIKIGESYLNRYWDDSDQPRQESYLEDVEQALNTSTPPENLYRDIRAACESGWDFSSRWFLDGNKLSSIGTTKIVPVDLNALLYNLESTLAKASDLAGNAKDSAFYHHRAASRAELINAIFFDQISGIYMDVLLPDYKLRGLPTLASMYPLFCNIATVEQANSTARVIKERFLQPGGWVTTLNDTGQQWDAPNGWAPLQWITYLGLRQYGFNDDAEEGARRWVTTNSAIYERTGKLVEKYDVVNVGELARGGEYILQDGFGWTNGVLLRLLEELDMYR